jgi:hypothetical protein
MTALCFALAVADPALAGMIAAFHVICAVLFVIH